MNTEKIKAALIEALLSRQRSLEIEGIMFELLPILKRDIQSRREKEAIKIAEDQLKILLTD